MDITYQMVVLGHGGLYTYGEHAATPELAKLSPGNLIRTTYNGVTCRLGVEECRWERRADGKLAVTRRVLVEAEDSPGQWTIGP